MTNAPTVVRAFRTAGTGPANLRHTLQGQARQLRQSLRGTRQLSAVEAQLPGALFGDALTAFLSDRLRSLLDRDRAPEPVPLSSRSGGDAPARAEDTRRAPRSINDVHDQLLASAALEWPAGASPSPPARVPDALPRASTSVAERADSPLARALREYWQLTKGDVSRRVSPGERAEHASGQANGNTTAPPQPASPSARVPADQMAGRMNAFVSGTPTPAGSPRTLAPPDAGDTARRPSPATATPFSLGARRELLRTDLAQTLADVLREQAILHGVDLS